MRPAANAVTFEEFERRQRNNGGGGPGCEESILAPVWRRWAMNIINEKRAALAFNPNTPARYIQETRLGEQFDRVCENTDAACSVIRDHSPYYPYVKFLM